MRRVLAVVAVAAIIVAVAVAVFYASIHIDSTSCFAAFESHTAAERAGERARTAGIEVDVESPGSGARRSNSRGARAISVSFHTGETGDDAAPFRETVRQIAKQEGAIREPVVIGCSERSAAD